MIKFQEIQIGDYVMANNDGDKRRGEVTDLNGDEKQVSVNIGPQSFWYEQQQLDPIAITNNELMNLKFQKHINDDGTVKYMKGAFRMLIPKEDDFSRMEIWYRDEQRHIVTPISLHNLQNHFFEMTKVHLNDGVF
ncbi:MAG: hypothetical protein JSU03_03985 [Bacteroidetes bacterium]|nr:hypothetical protein [Bacteroidota bacterium]MBS1756414.1 hypothetical protein [Bacteroidota bacterium]